MGFSARLPVPVATLTLTTSIQGMAIDTETNEVLLTDPDSTSISIFNALDNRSLPSPIKRTKWRCRQSADEYWRDTQRSEQLIERLQLGTQQLLGTVMSALTRWPSRLIQPATSP